jgi:putative transposase
VRILCRASGWYALLSVEIDAPESSIEPAGHPVGIDVGLESFLTTSEGEHVEPPQFFRRAQGKLKSLQRQLKRKHKGSNRMAKLRSRIARQHERIANQRKDWHRKLAHHLCDGAGMLFAEELNLKGLNRGLFSKSFADAAFGAFLSTLAWVCRKRGVYFGKVDAAGTSQYCPECGVHTGAKPLSVRVHQCSECGCTTHRDVAAAQVVRNRGLASRWDNGSAAVGQAVKKLVEGKVV